MENPAQRWTAVRVRSLRAKLDLTQEEFAARAGVTLSVVSRWENDHAMPSRKSRRTLDGMATEVAA